MRDISEFQEILFNNDTVTMSQERIDLTNYLASIRNNLQEQCIEGHLKGHYTALNVKDTISLFKVVDLFNKDLAKALSELNENKNVLRQTQDELKSIKSKLTEALENLQKTRQELDSKLAQEQYTISKLTLIRAKFYKKDQEKKEEQLTLQKLLESVETAVDSKIKEQQETAQHLETTKGELASTRDTLATREGELAGTRATLATTEGELAGTRATLAKKNDELADTAAKLEEAEGKIIAIRRELESKKKEFSETFTSLINTEGQLKKQLKAIDAHWENEKITWEKQNELKKFQNETQIKKLQEIKLEWENISKQEHNLCVIDKPPYSDVHDKYKNIPDYLNPKEGCKTPEEVKNYIANFQKFWKEKSKPFAKAMNHTSSWKDKTRELDYTINQLMEINDITLDKVEDTKKHESHTSQSESILIYEFVNLTELFLKNCVDSYHSTFCEGGKDSDS